MTTRAIMARTAPRRLQVAPHPRPAGWRGPLPRRASHPGGPGRPRVRRRASRCPAQRRHGEGPLLPQGASTLAPCAATLPAPCGRRAGPAPGRVPGPPPPATTPGEPGAPAAGMPPPGDAGSGCAARPCQSAGRRRNRPAPVRLRARRAPRRTTPATGWTRPAPLAEPGERPPPGAGATPWAGSRKTRPTPSGDGGPCGAAAPAPCARPGSACAQGNRGCGDDGADWADRSASSRSPRGAPRDRVHQPAVSGRRTPVPWRTRRDAGLPAADRNETLIRRTAGSRLRGTSPPAPARPRRHGPPRSMSRRRQKRAKENNKEGPGGEPPSAAVAEHAHYSHPLQTVSTKVRSATIRSRVHPFADCRFLPPLLSSWHRRRPEGDGRARTRGAPADPGSTRTDRAPRCGRHPRREPTARHAGTGIGARASAARGGCPGRRNRSASRTVHGCGPYGPVRPLLAADRPRAGLAEAPVKSRPAGGSRVPGLLSFIHTLWIAC